tara:strand:- start:726 stop:878 length:153 start_codon:yes stop_codon:yes gene_type:complete
MSVRRIVLKNQEPRPPDGDMGSLEFMGIPNWLAFAVIGFVFILMVRGSFF